MPGTISFFTLPSMHINEVIFWSVQSETVENSTHVYELGGHDRLNL